MSTQEALKRRTLRRVVGETLERIASGIAIGMLRVLGALCRPAQAEPVAHAGRVLFVGAHPDDESLFAGATLAEHERLGDTVTLVVVTTGAGSKSAGATANEAAARRAFELANAATALGIQRIVRLGHQDLHWHPVEIVEQLRDIAAQADVIYTHGPVDFHPDHFGVAEAVAAVVVPGQLVRVTGAQCLLTPVLANRVFSASADAWGARGRAIAAHISQAGTASTCARQHGLMANARGQALFEEFWEMDGAAFARVMDKAAWTRTRHSPMRSVRQRGFSDPLAVLWGLRARLWLWRVANQPGGKPGQ